MLLKGRRGGDSEDVLLPPGKVGKALPKRVRTPLPSLTIQLGAPDWGMLGGFATGTGKEDSPSQSTEGWRSRKAAISPRRDGAWLPSSWSSDS